MIIGITGRAGSGKSTLAEGLIQRGFVRVRFVDPLKEMLRAIGLSDDQVNGHLKEIPTAILEGKTPRFAMQTLGTEWGRNLISPTIWITLWRRMIAAQLAAGKYHIVVDDLRFLNEAEAIRSYNGKIWRVVRDVPAGQHLSETEMQLIDEDTIIANTSTIGALWETADHLIRSK